MRRALGLLGLIVMGVLIGFLIRLVWPRRRRLELDAAAEVWPRGDTGAS
jgi:hypothetical protein